MSPPPSPPAPGDMPRTESYGSCAPLLAMPGQLAIPGRAGAPPTRRAGAPPLPPGPPPPRVLAAMGPPPGITQRPSALDIAAMRAPLPPVGMPSPADAMYLQMSAHRWATQNGRAQQYCSSAHGRDINGGELNGGLGSAKGVANGSANGAANGGVSGTANGSANGTVKAVAHPLGDLIRSQNNWEVPPTMPDHLLRTLYAEARRDGSTEDPMQLAQMLVDAYTRTRQHSETWGMATGYGKRKKLSSLMMLQRWAPPKDQPSWDAAAAAPSSEPDGDPERKQLIADALAVAVDGATCDKRIMQSSKAADGLGVVDLPTSVDTTTGALKDELEDARDDITMRPPCCRKRRKRPSSTAKVAPEYEYDAMLAEQRKSQKTPQGLLKDRAGQVVVQARLRRLAAAHRGARVAPE